MNEKIIDNKTQKTRIWTDFNAVSTNGLCWILFHEENDLGEKIEELGLSEGSTIILYQDGDDFDVEAILQNRYVEAPCCRTTWCAAPDWSTLRRKQSNQT